MTTTKLQLELAFALALGGCGATTPSLVDVAADNGPAPESITWTDSGSAGQFYADGELLATLSCANLDDPRIAGSDADFAAYLDDNCTDTVVADAPVTDPCGGDAGLAVDADGEGYSIDTCVPTSADDGDPYWGFVAQWVEVPSWTTDYDAECYVDPASGAGCCNYYVDIDPSELSSCDAVFAMPVAVDDGGAGSASTPFVATGSGDLPNAPPGNNVPGPPPKPPANIDPIMSRIGSILIALGGLTGLTGQPVLGKAIVDIGSGLVKGIDDKNERNSKMKNEKNKNGGAGAPPDELPPWERDVFKRGGRRPPAQGIPARPPAVLPPGGRPVTKPGQIFPQPSVRPPFRPPPRGGKG